MEPITRELLHFEKLPLDAANEAVTRLRVIDKVLRDILGWAEEDMHVEEHVSEDGKQSFADYVLRTANVAVIVEAKKIGATFKFDATHRRERLTSSFLVGEMGAAVVQARDYCRKLGVDFAVVTNGLQWIVFPAQRHDGVRFHESTAVLFPSLRSILIEDFKEFHDLLSREAVIDGSLEMAFLGNTRNQFANRTLGKIFGESGSVTRRNPIYPLIQSGVEIAFSESFSEISDKDLLAKFYVDSPERARFDQRINMHLIQRTRLTDQAPARPMKPTGRGAMIERLTKALSRSKPVAILVLGSVGVGKTTFLDYTKRVKAAQFFDKKDDGPYPHWIQIDFRKFTSGESPKDFIYNSVLEYLIEDPYFKDYDRSIEHAYRKEIASLRSGFLSLITKDDSEVRRKISDLIQSDYMKVAPYVEKLIRVAVQQSPVFLVIDNIDQLEAETLQARLFSDVLAIGQQLGVNLVISMRGATYVKYKHDAIFDAYDFDSLQIDSPVVDSVLSKRFQIATYLLKDKASSFVGEDGSKISIPDTGRIIELIQASVLGTEVGRLITILSADDIRLALRMTRRFLELGYTDPARALKTTQRGRQYILPKHEAFRAVLNAGNPFYSEALSDVGNPFDSRQGRTEMQQLRFYILAALVNHASNEDFRQKDVQKILENLRRIGFPDRVSMTVLKDICKLRFAFTVSYAEVDENTSIVPTRLGGYIVRDLLANFVFLEAMLVDTFIANAETWDKLKTLTEKVLSERGKRARIDLRIERVKIFYGMLSEQIGILCAAARKKGLEVEWQSNPFEEANMRFKDELARVQMSAKRLYKRTETRTEDADEVTALLDLDRGDEEANEVS